MNYWTASRIKATKGKQKLACLTAYDYSTALIMDQVGIELILVGDSLGMTVLGYPTTLPVTMEQMLHHTTATVRGVKNALVVADMPFLSYQGSIESAVVNAGRFIKDAGAGAVKIEGGGFRAPLIQCLVQNGIPVLGHIGLTPQSICEFGGFKVQGRDTETAQKLLEDAKILEQAGIFAIVLECIPAGLAAEITKTINVPTIGIGAGSECDGQILVVHDMLGLYTEIKPKFVKQYANLAEEMKKAFETYKQEVKTGKFPADSHSYS